MKTPQTRVERWSDYQAGARFASEVLRREGIAEAWEAVKRQEAVEVATKTMPTSAWFVGAVEVLLHAAMQGSARD